MAKRTGLRLRVMSRPMGIAESILRQSKGSTDPTGLGFLPEYRSSLQRPRYSHRIPVLHRMGRKVYTDRQYDVTDPALGVSYVSH